MVNFNAQLLLTDKLNHRFLHDFIANSIIMGKTGLSFLVQLSLKDFTLRIGYLH
jgi:hypothetical protein